MRAARIALTASTEPKFGVNRSEAVRERLLRRGCFGRYSGRSSTIALRGAQPIGQEAIDGAPAHAS